MILNLGGSGDLLHNPKDPPWAPSLAPSIASATQNKSLSSAAAFSNAMIYQANKMGALAKVSK